MRPSIFVSYSHRDAALVTPVVALLRASEALVFRDADGLKPGKRWREQLSTAIGESKIVLVFWCHHAAASEDVRKEYSSAIESGKDVLPVLLDATPLPSELADFQYIDFREAFLHERAVRALAPMRLGYWFFPTLALVALAWGISSMWTFQSPVPSNDPPGPNSPAWFWQLGVAAGMLVLFVLVRSVLRRHNQNQADPSTADSSEHQLLLASTIGAELRRRTRNSDAAQ